MKCLCLVLMVILPCTLNAGTVTQSISNTNSQNFTTVISGTIVIPTCNVQGAANFSKTIKLGSYTIDQLTNGLAEDVPVPMQIVCRHAANVSITYLNPNEQMERDTPATDFITTDKPGIIIGLRWADPDFSDSVFSMRTLYRNGTDIYDASLIATVAKISNFDLTQGGSFHANLVFTINYD